MIFQERNMRAKLLPLLLGIVLLICACTPRMIPPVAPTTLPPTDTPTPRTLTVLAAASLTDSFTELGQLFERQHPGVIVSFNFGGSQQLAQQLDQGAPADVFASANTKYMKSAITSKRVAEGTSAIFVTNRLVVIFSKDTPASMTALQDLAEPNLKLDLADPSVPVGQYSIDFLDKAVQDSAFGADFKDNVLKNVVSYETNVKAVVTKVSLGEADAGIVYITDYQVAADKLGYLDIPDTLNSIASYPIAPITDSQNADLAEAFVALVFSPEGQAIMAKYGFVTISQ